MSTTTTFPEKTTYLEESNEREDAARSLARALAEARNPKRSKVAREQALAAIDALDRADALEAARVPVLCKWCGKERTGPQDECGGEGEGLCFGRSADEIGGMVVARATVSLVLAVPKDSTVDEVSEAIDRAFLAGGLYNDLQEPATGPGVGVMRHDVSNVEVEAAS